MKGNKTLLAGRYTAKWPEDLQSPAGLILEHSRKDDDGNWALICSLTAAKPGFEIDLDLKNGDKIKFNSILDFRPLGIRAPYEFQ